MRRSALILLPALISGCSTLSRAKAAEAMQCPEDELQEGDVQNPEEAKVVAALLLLPLAMVTRVAVPTPGGQTSRRWSGCGMTYDCTSDGCSESPGSRASNLVKAVPDLMERSRRKLGDAATVERSGYFSWELSAPRGKSHCSLRSKETYYCDPDLEAPPAPVAEPSAPPPPPGPPREPLRAKTP